MNTQPPKKILIIDDDSFIAEIIQVSLEMHGNFSIDVRSTGQSAIAFVEENTPEVIILDLLLEDFDGLDLLGQLKQNETLQNTHFIVLTGSDESSVRRKAMDTGASLYVQKPFAPSQLVTDIKKLLQGI